jgi:WD40 repeat protein
MKTIRVFVSSPGDVQKERKLADNLIRSVADEFGIPVSVIYSNLLRSDEIATESLESEDTTLVLCPYFWEYQRFSPDQGYQEQIPNTAKFDLIICILWSRLGTQLAPKFKLPDGSRPRSGTDYEIAWALHQAQKTPGTPALHIYRNRTMPSFPLEPEDQYQELVGQWKSLKSFFAQLEKDSEGHFVAAFNNYSTLDEFEDLFRVHFRDYLVGRLDPGGPERVLIRKTKRWGANPFRGLEVFEFEHAPIFYGRTKQIGELLDLVVQLANSGMVFVLVLGASGSGKSSLLRAGVLPLLTEPGTVEGIGVWRRAVTKPAAAGSAADPFDALAAALLAPAALPELADQEATNPINEIAHELREQPGAVALRVKHALRTVALLWKNNYEQTLQNRESEMRAAGRADDADLALQQWRQLTEPKARLALVVDQIEELFTAGFSAEVQQKYVAAITGLARGGRVYVMATLRSDFYARYQEFPELVELAKPGRFDLGPPGPGEIGSIIRHPAEAAGLSFEKGSESGQALDEALRDAAANNPESLPLLEHALDQLFQGQAERQDGVLRWSDYRKMGGLEGALAEHAEATFRQLRPHEQGAFELVMGQLVTLGQGQEEVPNRRTASYSDFCPSGSEPDERAGTQGFVDLFVKNRLFVADTDPGGNVVISVAHEALLREWDRIRTWLSSNRDFLRVRNRLDASLRNWKERGGQKSDLLQTGLPLAEGEKLLSEFGSCLSTEQIDYIQASIAEQHRQRRRRSRIRNGILAAVSILALVAGVLAAAAGFQWAQAETARENAEQQRQRAEEAVTAQKKQLEHASWASFNQADLQISRGEWQEGIAHLARAVKFNPENKVAAERFFQQLILGRWRVRIPLAAFHHDDEIYSVVFSPDGSKVLTASWDNTAKLWDAASGKELAAFHHERSVNSAVFSPDGSKVLTASWDATAKLWDAASGKELAAFLHDDVVNSAVFSPDGSKVLTAGRDATAKLWDAASGKELATFLQVYSVSNAVFSPDGSKVLTASYDQTAKLWDAASGEGLAAFHRDGGVTSAVFSPDGSKVLTASRDKTAKLWDAASGKELAIFHHDDVVYSAVFSPDGSKVLTASNDKAAKLWDAASGKELSVFHQDGRVSRAVFSPDGSKVLTASHDGTAKLWDATSGKELAAFHHDGWVSSAVFSPDGSKVLTAGEDHAAKLWDAVSGRELAAFHHDEKVTSGVFSPDGSKVLTASYDQTAKLWDTASGEELAAFDHNEWVYSAVFSPNGLRVLTASKDKTAKLWDAASGKELAAFHHDDVVNSAVFSPDGSKVLTAGEDKTAKLWDAVSGGELAAFDHDDSVLSAVFGPDGSKVLTASRDSTARLWDAISGKELAAFHHEKAVTSAVFSPDGSKVLTASWDATAKLWDAASGKELAAFHHDETVTSAVFSPDGSKALTASHDGTAKLWDATSGKELAAFHHDGWVSSAVFSPDGSKVLTASEDHSAKLWDAGSGKELASLHHDDLVYSAVFSPDGSTILTASEDHNAKLWDAATARSLASLLTEFERRAADNDKPSADSSILRDIGLLSELASGREVADDGSLNVIPYFRFSELKQQLEDSAKNDQLLSRFIRWFCSAGEDVTTFPSSGIASAIWVDNQILTISQLSEDFATEAFQALPGRPLPEIVMAQFVKDSAGARFLRSQALERLPKNSQICIRAAELLRDQGQSAQAVIAADKALVVEKLSLPAHRLRAECLDDLNRWDEALSEYQTILARPDALGFDFGQTAYLAARMGKGDFCDAVFAHGIARFPNNSNLYYYWGRALLNLHRPAEAVTAFETAEKLLEGGEPSAFLLAGEAAANWTAGAKEKAITTYIRLINIDKAWADSNEMSQLKWPEAEKQPVAKLLAETLRQHPELKPQLNRVFDLDPF